MSEENKEEKPAVKVIKVIHSGEALRYYTNNTEIGMTSYDLSLKFAVIDHADADGLHVRDQAIISMSMHHAKAVARILTAYVAQFEHQHGLLSPLDTEAIEIDIPSDKVVIKA